MESCTDDRTDLQGNVIAVLQDKDEYPSIVDNFGMRGRVLTWRSLAIDCKYKAGAARDFVRARGLLREAVA